MRCFRTVYQVCVIQSALAAHFASNRRWSLLKGAWWDLRDLFDGRVGFCANWRLRLTYLLVFSTASTLLVRWKLTSLLSFLWNSGDLGLGCVQILSGHFCWIGLITHFLEHLMDFRLAMSLARTRGGDPDEPTLWLLLFALTWWEWHLLLELLTRVLAWGSLREGGRRIWQYILLGSESITILMFYLTTEGILVLLLCYCKLFVTLSLPFFRCEVLLCMRLILLRCFKMLREGDIIVGPVDLNFFLLLILLMSNWTDSCRYRFVNLLIVSSISVA